MPGVVVDPEALDFDVPGMMLYYELETGLREGPILSPVLYLLFINGLVLQSTYSYLCVLTNVSMLMESGLSPACVLRAQGLLRLWGVAQTREPDSLLGLAWSMGEEYKVRLGKECISTAVDEINREYCSTIECPEPNLRKVWKQAVGEVSACSYSKL
jgi:hypothetical protein